MSIFRKKILFIFTLLALLTINVSCSSNKTDEEVAAAGGGEAQSDFIVDSEEEDLLFGGGSGGAGTTSQVAQAAIVQDPLNPTSQTSQVALGSQISQGSQGLLGSQISPSSQLSQLSQGSQSSLASSDITTVPIDGPSTVTTSGTALDAALTAGSDTSSMAAISEPVDSGYSSVTSSSVYSKGGTGGSYTVERGDTLMLIAFKVYGDYRKWKNLVRDNPGKDMKHLSRGQAISYNSGDGLNWQPHGNPYLIRQGDTLGLISKDKYGTPKKWKSIWDNNRPLILDPNLIFAGFTIYYIPLRDLASGK